LGWRVDARFAQAGLLDPGTELPDCLAKEKRSCRRSAAGQENRPFGSSPIDEWTSGRWHLPQRRWSLLRPRKSMVGSFVTLPGPCRQAWWKMP